MTLVEQDAERGLILVRCDRCGEHLAAGPDFEAGPPWVDYRLGLELDYDAIEDLCLDCGRAIR